MNNFSSQFKQYKLPTLGWTRLPKPPISQTDREKFGCGDGSNFDLLCRLVYVGFEQKLQKGHIPESRRDEYYQRCEMELQTFKELFFVDYMLLVWKVVEKAKEMGVFIDHGRGSVAGSIVSWMLGISGCDPIKFNLFFSRFLNKARAESKMIDGEVWTNIGLALDIDLNLGDGRDKIVTWLKEIYPNRICKVSNVSTLTGKILIKDVYKTFENASEEQSKEIADLIDRRFGIVQDIKDVYKDNVEFKKWADTHESYNIALKLRDLIRQSSSHASGYLVSFEELTDHTPLCLDSDKQVCSAYTMDNVQCIKLDLLGLETNFIIKNILDHLGSEVDVEKLNLEDDPLIYDQFQHGNLLPYGLYQISADCAYNVCRNLKPKNVMELSHVNGIARPTALAYEKPYLENKTICPHPLLENALKWTRYQPLYQEQTLMCLKAIGFDDVEAEMARRVFAKKKHHEVELQINKIKEKLLQNNLPKEVGDVVIKLAEEGANYQFNLSHSLATSYLTALTVYLKYKYPLQFYVACLNSAKNKPDFVNRFGQIYKELQYFNIRLLPPHILLSSTECQIEGPNIRMGLSSIKSISEKSLDKLKQFQHQYKNKFDIFKSAKSSGLNLSAVSALILVGSLDETIPTNETRSRIQMEYCLWNIMTDKERIWAEKLGEEFKYNLVEIVKALNERILNEKGKPIIKDSRRLTIRRDLAPYKEIYEYNNKHTELSHWYFETCLLGFSYSTNLYNIYSKERPDLLTLGTIAGEPQNSHVNFVAQVIEIKQGASKEKKTPYLKVWAKDHTGQVKIMIFDSAKNKNIEQMINLNGRLPKEDDVIVVTGSKMDGDCVFARTIGIQKMDVFLKISQLPKTKTNGNNSVQVS